MGRLDLTCRRCGAAMAVDDEVPLPRDFPFCTERCRLIDLGKWFDEEFKVSRAVQEQDLDTVD